MKLPESRLTSVDIAMRLFRRVGGQPPSPTVPVWDAPIRLFHWLLLVTVAFAAFTGFISGLQWLGPHLIAGIAVACLVGLRLVWGVFGSGHARFGDFAYPPRAVIRHVGDLLAARVHRHLGHNPLGAMMVFALLAILSATVITGAIALGGMFKQGPLAAFTSFAIGSLLLSVHQAFAIVLLVLIGAHGVGVAFESWRGQENLTAAMITGRKRPVPDAAERNMRPVRPLLAAASVLVLGGGATAGVIRLAAKPVHGLPPPTLDPTYDGDCGSCHFVYSPSLNSSAIWNEILDHLDHHFGEDASLPPAEVAQLRAYLDTNAAQHWDTLAANEFRVRDPANPLRITATPYWRQMHAG
ncbi:MAG: cytochrome b/b6 domain-containing protein, partial [Acetobacteraceae bacterium]